MKTKKKFKMNLQLFAEPDGDNGQGDNTDPIDDKNKGGEPNPDGDQTKTFTQEELDNIITKRLARKDQEVEDRIAELKRELELDKLPEGDKEKAKLDLEKEKLEKERTEFEQTKKELEASKLCDELDIPNDIGLALAKAYNMDEVKVKASQIQKTIATHVQLKVLEQLKGNGHNPGQNSGTGNNSGGLSVGERLAKKRLEQNTNGDNNPYF